MQGETLVFLEGLQRLKHVYVELLIKTASDFTQRHVARAALRGSDATAAVAGPPKSLSRTNSRELNDALERQVLRCAQ